MFTLPKKFINYNQGTYIRTYVKLQIFRIKKSSNRPLNLTADFSFKQKLIFSFVLLYIDIRLLEDSIKDFIIDDVLSQYTFLFSQLQENTSPQGTCLCTYLDAVAGIYIPK